MADKPKLKHTTHGEVERIETPKGCQEAPKGKFWAKCADGQTRLLSLNLTDQ